MTARAIRFFYHSPANRHTLARQPARLSSVACTAWFTIHYDPLQSQLKDRSEIRRTGTIGQAIVHAIPGGGQARSRLGQRA